MSTEKSSKTKQRVLLVLLLLAVPALILLFSRMEHTYSSLPHFYPVDVIKTKVDGEMLHDTIWHTIPSFDFVDQDSLPLNNSFMEGHITVVDFFFTTCTTICPKMTRQMKTLVWMLEGEYFKEVRYLSISVDPEYDSPHVLKKYIEEMEAEDAKWKLATGNKQEIYDLGVNGFFLTTQEDLELAGNFLHSEKFVLVDNEGHIRGYYDGTSPDEVRDLSEDVKMLIGEERKVLKK